MYIVFSTGFKLVYKNIICLATEEKDAVVLDESVHSKSKLILPKSLRLSSRFQRFILGRIFFIWSAALFSPYTALIKEHNFIQVSSVRSKTPYSV